MGTWTLRLNDQSTRSFKVCKGEPSNMFLFATCWTLWVGAFSNVCDILLHAAVVTADISGNSRRDSWCRSNGDRKFYRWAEGLE